MIHKTHTTIWLSILTVLTSCSIFSSSSTKTFSLDFPRHFHSWTLDPIDVERNVYRVSLDSKGNQSAYLSAIRECPIASSAGLRGLTRQLFVSFDEVEIIDQKELEMADITVLETTAIVKDAELLTPIRVYSVREGECVSNFSLWDFSQQGVDGEESDKAEWYKTFDPFVSNLIRHSIKG